MKESAIFMRCRKEAMPNEGLMPADCIQILENNYGKRLERIKPKTIHSMVESLMRLATDCIDHEQIEETVQQYCNSF